MAIFSMNNEDYEDNELFDESGDILDNMLEACDQMLDALNEHGGARNKYVKMKADEAIALKKKADSMPDKTTKSSSKKIGPYTFTASKEVRNKEKDNVENKYYDAMEKASIYAGSGKKSTSYHKEKLNGKTVHVGNGHLTYPEISKDYAKDAGKPHNRYDSGSHKYIDNKYMLHRSKTQDYERIVNSKNGKDKFMEDFGGPSGNKHPHKFENADSKWQQDHNKEQLKKHFEKKKAIKETCLTILSMIDDI